MGNGPNSGAPANSQDDVLIAVMGTTGVGKSTFIKAASGLDVDVGDDYDSRISLLRLMSLGRSVTLVDMPGYDDSSTPDAQMLAAMADWLVDSYGSGRKLNGILWLESLAKTRLGGSGYKALELFQAVCGDDFMRNVICVTTFGHAPRTAQEKTRENQLQTKIWLPLKMKNALITEQFDNFDRDDPTESANATLNAKRIVSLFFNYKPNATKLQEEIVDNSVNFENTDAAKYANKDYKVMKDKYEKDAAKFKAQVEQAQKDGDAAKGKLAELQQQINQDKADNIAAQQAAMKQFADETKRLRELLSKNTVNGSSGGGSNGGASNQNQSGSKAAQWFQALKAGDTTTLKSLLSSGFDINTQNDSGRTCLYFAAHSKTLTLMKFLLRQNGVDISIQDSMGYSAIHFAIAIKKSKAAALLIEAADSSDLDTTDMWGGTPLHEACIQSSVDAAQDLIDAGAELDIKDQRGYTPLHWAAKKGYINLAKLLLKAGADPTKRTATGKTPRQLAEKYDNPNTAREIKRYE
ncbi:hypothetical protein B7494_g4170 [Chlorociboria aeruginascens]|nr:hypothetical protein B7494_g4170 [Chlorociboria aeruginascens]